MPLVVGLEQEEEEEDTMAPVCKGRTDGGRISQVLRPSELDFGIWTRLRMVMCLPSPYLYFFFERAASRKTGGRSSSSSSTSSTDADDDEGAGTPPVCGCEVM